MSSNLTASARTTYQVVFFRLSSSFPPHRLPLDRIQLVGRQITELAELLARVLDVRVGALKGFGLAGGGCATLAGLGWIDTISLGEYIRPFGSQIRAIAAPLLGTN